MNAKEEALKLCQRVSYTSLQTEINNGKPLPIEFSKKVSELMVTERIKMLGELWGNKQIGNWEYIEMSNYNSELKREVKSIPIDHIF